LLGLRTPADTAAIVKSEHNGRQGGGCLGARCPAVRGV